jgi:hypothetical protein
MPLPDFRKLERVRYYDMPRSKEAYRNVWRAPLTGPDLVLLEWPWEEVRLPPPDTKWPRMEPIAYTDELAEFIRFLPVRAAARTGEWPYKLLCRQDSMVGIVSFRDAYAAAVLGKADEARLLMRAALQQDGGDVKAAYDFARYDSYARGARMLRAGAPLADVLAEWQDALQFLREQPLAGEVKDLAAELAKQVEEDKRLAATEVKDPESLPPQERIACYIARFPEVCGEQRSIPGACGTTGMGERTRFSDAIVKIGRPAVPALIEHLSDRRVTRSVGGDGMAGRLYVLRVQDVALECTERILGLWFHNGRYFSEENESERRQVIAEIQAWWDKNGAKSPVEGFIAYLDKHPGDLDTLRKIEAIDPKAVDSRAIIKKWAVDLPAGLLPRLAIALAERGDLTLIDTLRRERLSRGRAAPDDECVWALLRFGNADDFRYLRAAARKDRESGGRLDVAGFFSAVASGVKNSRSPLAVPILVDFLDERKACGSRAVAAGVIVSFSLADSCQEALIRLTGHDEGYVAADPDAKRFAAIDRWIAWWTKEGKAAFLKAHPEVAPVWAEPDAR